ncbi:hypothetical protein Tco_0709074 [Tanacetum coccineum]
MDSMIPIGQKNTLAEYMILSSADNRPPMLDKDLYDSWKSRMELYMQNRDRGRMILESVEHGPLIWPTIEENEVTRTKKYDELSATEKIQAGCNFKATNIILQGLPSDIYSLVNHHRVSKDLWERIQLLMQGTSLTKQERECKLYDVFDKFAHIKGESLHQYYLRFTQLINDMNIYKMKLEQYQVNTKFLNSLPPEKSKFVIDVKLVKDLHTTNFHQFHAYLQQHELHANEVRIMLNQQTHLAEFPQIDSGLAVLVFKQGDDVIDATNKMMSFLSTVITSRFPSTNNQLRNSSNPRQQATIHDGRGKTQGNGKVLNEEELEFLADLGVPEGPVTQMVITHNAAYQADDLDAYDSDCDDFSIAKAVLMANFSSYGSYVLSEVPHSKSTYIDMLNQSVQEMSHYEQTHLVNYPKNEITSDSNIIPYSHYLLETQNAVVQDTNSFTQQDAMILSLFEQLSNQFADFEKEINYLKQTLSEQSKEKELLTKTFNVFKNESKEKEAKNIDKEISLEKKVKELDNIVCKIDQIISQDIVNIGVNSSLDINTSMNVNSSIAMNDSVNYVEMCNKCLELEAELFKQHNMVEKDEYNRLSKSFYILKQHCISLELAMQLNKEIFQKNNKSVNQTEPSFDQLFELNNLKAELQAKDTTIEKLKANIKRLNKTSTTNSVKKDIDEIETINIELEHKVTKLNAENEHLKQTYKQLYDSIKPSRVRAKDHAESLVNQLNQKYVEITDLNAQLQEMVFVITAFKNDHRKFKGKDIVDNVAHESNATTIAPGMYKLDPVTLARKDKNNRETHIYYLKHTIEQAAILREIVEQAKLLNPLDSASYSAYKYVKLIQELLGYVRDTCPNIQKPSEKLVDATPINKKKTVRSKSIDNTKNDRILQISSSTQKKNKVEDHSRIVNFVFDAKHELFFLEFVSDMNASSKSKSVKKAIKKEEWKPTRKVFTKIGYNWRPTGRTFTLVGNACPLTRITATNKVPLREPVPLEATTQESVVTKVYTRRPKVPKTNGSNNKPKIAKSVISNKTEPSTSRGEKSKNKLLGMIV